MKKSALKQLIKEEWYHLKETTDDEETPKSSGLKGEYNIVVTIGEDEVVEDAVDAFSKIDNYGIYLSNLRKDPKVNKAIEAEFGPSMHVRKKKLEKERGEPFPTKTKQAIDNLLKTLVEDGDVGIVNFEVEDDKLIFPKSKNPSKVVTEKIINTVLKNAGIKDYDIEEKEIL